MPLCTLNIPLFHDSRYSLRDTNTYRAQEGLAPVSIAGAGVYVEKQENDAYLEQHRIPGSEL